MSEETAEVIFEVIFVVLGVTLVTFEFLWIRACLELQKLKRELKTKKEA